MGRHIFNEKAQRWVWSCDACGRTAFWGDSWGWFGSYLQMESNNPPPVSCGPACATRIRENDNRALTDKQRREFVGTSKPRGLHP